MKVGTDGVLLGAWASAVAPSFALDIGTGTGLIAIMLAQRYPSLQHIDAVEVDESAALQAERNVAASPWAERIHIHQTRVQSFTSAHNGLYELIVSNPPYFTHGTVAHQENRKKARHNVDLPYIDLILAVDKLMSPHGHFCLILPRQEGLGFVDMAKDHRLYCTHMTHVRSKLDKPVERLLLVFERSKSLMKEQVLTLQYEQRNHFRPEYRALVQDFYTIL